MTTMKTTSSLLLVGALVASSTSIQAVEMPKMPEISRTTIAAVAAASLGAALYTRKSEKDFTPRYNIKKTRNITQVFSKDYVQNLWYLFYDGFIGQRKQSSTLKAKEDGKVYASEETPAYGVLGTVDSYVTPIVDSAKTYLFGLGLIQFARDPKSIGTLMEIIAGKGKATTTPAPAPAAPAATAV